MLGSAAWRGAHGAGRAALYTREACDALLGLLVADGAQRALGKTKVFFRARVLEGLEQRRAQCLEAHPYVHTAVVSGGHGSSLRRLRMVSFGYAGCSTLSEGATKSLSYSLSVDAAPGPGRPKVGHFSR